MDYEPWNWKYGSFDATTGTVWIELVRRLCWVSDTTTLPQLATVKLGFKQ